MYQPKDSAVLARQLKVQKLSIPFAITGHATPASKVVLVDEPSILFLQLEGIDRITEAAGGVEDDSTLPTMTGETDTTGIFFASFRLREVTSKVVSCKVVNRATTEILACILLASADSGATPIVKIDSGIDLSAANMDAVLELEYIVS